MIMRVRILLPLRLPAGRPVGLRRRTDMQAMAEAARSSLERVGLIRMDLRNLSLKQLTFAVVCVANHFHFSVHDPDAPDASHADASESSRAPGADAPHDDATGLDALSLSLPLVDKYSAEDTTKVPLNPPFRAP
uniref:Uncharacterized protein n=1 Tax=Chromera velia CCMP2878 TaxID=1169474 RepID=A0A0G4HTG4_9ALVE|eukprot:Cvel_31402.t1-p1 / transcript=Cvel_31402.t1 / gene=Cvel_31402 / organism=Chromera_velia_CCMP2878 / gene_product=hypothetical protein / transcript_product=hypothetical protein / location=Cvel_scaffold4674:2971-5252(-) / protein_length=133 / sequence_SO=supercontig / SO=protein_coding / is_pseudo=false